MKPSQAEMEAGAQADPALVAATLVVAVILTICAAIAMWPELRGHVRMWHERRGLDRELARLEAKERHRERLRHPTGRRPK